MAGARSSSRASSSLSSSSEDEEEKSAIVHRFYDILQRNFLDVAWKGQHKEAWGGNSLSYAHELQIVRRHYTPILWGIGSAVLTFASFRIGKSDRIRHLVTGRGGGGVGSTNVKQYQMDRRQTAPSSSLENEYAQKKQTINDLLSLPVDVILSLLIGSSAAMFLTDEERLLHDAANLPLVPGRSLVSEVLCEDFNKEYRRTPRRVWERKGPKGAGGDGEVAPSPSLDAIREFVSNCQKRSLLERELRKQRGLGSNESVSVPWPGVPENMDCVEVVEGQQDEEGEYFDASGGIER